MYTETPRTVTPNHEGQDAFFASQPVGGDYDFSEPSCPACRGDHSLVDCPAFEGPTGHEPSYSSAKVH